MTADRVLALVGIVVLLAALWILSRRKLARMNSAERAQFDRNIAPVAGFLNAFMWFWVIAGVGAGVDAAVHGVWPISVALFAIAVGLAFGQHNRWWIGR